ncbi:MAG: type II toxin-antitoxin system VapB family antitoxin [Rubrivivax sp.]|nr:type II toxin-antitoxin system VapB family antitoxin [Rubrivivax sp.]
MRTNIDIDDALMDQAMQAGPYKTKKDAVEAGLKLLARQAAYREILKWEGRLQWEGDAAADWTRPAEGATATLLLAREPAAPRAAAEESPKPRAQPRAKAAGGARGRR